MLRQVLELYLHDKMEIEARKDSKHVLPKDRTAFIGYIIDIPIKDCESPTAWPPLPSFVSDVGAATACSTVIAISTDGLDMCSRVDSSRAPDPAVLLTQTQGVAVRSWWPSAAPLRRRSGSSTPTPTRTCRTLRSEISPCC